MTYPSTTNLMAFAEPKRDALSVVAKPATEAPVNTSLAKDLTTGKIHECDHFRKALWKAIQNVEKAHDQAFLVNAIANTQLGYLVYEQVSKQMASHDNRIHPTIVNRDGKSVLNQDTILQGLVAQLQIHALHSQNNA